MKIQMIVVGILFFASAGCQKSDGGTTTGNPLVSFKMTGSSAAATIANHRPQFFSPWWAAVLMPAWALPPPLMVDANALNVTLDDAWMVVKEVEFKQSELAEAGEVDGDEIAFTGPYVVNLLSSTPESFGQVRSSTGTLRRMKMKLHNASSLPSNAPPALAGKSIYWKGSVNGHAFTISSSEGYEFELAGPKAVTLSDNDSVLMTVHIANIIKKLNLADIAASGSQVDISENSRVTTSAAPCPTIEPSATDLYTCFNSGLKLESNLGRDDNGDDELSGEDTIK